MTLQTDHATILWITDLASGDAAPCAPTVHARGRLDGASVDVILADRAALLADPGALDALLAQPLDEIRYAPATCATDLPDAGDPLLTALQARQSPARLVLASVEPTASAPPTGTLILDDLGPRTPELLLNGLRWRLPADPLGARPDLLAVAADADRDVLAGPLASYRALVHDVYAGPPPDRALQIHLEGVPLLAGIDPVQVAEALAHSGLTLGAVALPPDDLTTQRRGAELALRWELLRPDAPRPTLRIGDRRERPEALLTALPPASRRDDDAARRVVFHALTRLPPEGRDAALPRAEEALGDDARAWIAGFRRYGEQGIPRVAVVPTWQCELRCRYCTIVKQDGRVMAPAVMDGALDLLLSGDGRDLELHFFGGEPMLHWPLVQHAVREGSARAAAEGRRMRFIITTNGVAMTEERLDWLAGHDVAFQLSLDGDPDTMNTLRRGRHRELDSYAHSAAHRADWYAARALPHDVIQVVHPDSVARMADNFRHIVDMGYRRVQVNYAIGTPWDTAATEAYARGLHAIGQELVLRWARGEDVVLINLLETLKRYRANLHPTVDFDGAVYGGNGFLYLEKRREGFRLGHLDDGHAYHRYVVDGLGEEDFFANWYWKGSADNNRRVGAVLASFVRWMRRAHPDRLPAHATALGATARARHDAAPAEGARA